MSKYDDLIEQIQEPAAATMNNGHADNTLNKDEQVSELVIKALENCLDPKIDTKKQLKALSAHMQVHEKTLARLLNRENRPTYFTVFKIYRFILKENDDAKILKLVPPAIQDYLLKVNPQVFEKGQKYAKKYTLSLDQDIQNNPVFAELFVLASTGGIKKTDVIQRFGSFGLDILTQMLQQNIIVEVGPQEFIAGSNQTTLSPESILTLGLQLSKSYSKPENGYELNRHFMGFFSESLSEETYKKWLEIDTEAYYKKIELLKHKGALGKKRAFTFMITETLEPKEKK